MHYLRWVCASAPRELASDTCSVRSARLCRLSGAGWHIPVIPVGVPAAPTHGSQLPPASARLSLITRVQSRLKRLRSPRAKAAQRRSRDPRCRLLPRCATPRILACAPSNAGIKSREDGAPTASCRRSALFGARSQHPQPSTNPSAATPSLPRTGTCRPKKTLQPCRNHASAAAL